MFLYAVCGLIIPHLRLHLISEQSNCRVPAKVRRKESDEKGKKHKLER